jgi:hypothetical protein
VSVLDVGPDAESDALIVSEKVSWDPVRYSVGDGVAEKDTDAEEEKVLEKEELGWKEAVVDRVGEFLESDIVADAVSESLTRTLIEASVWERDAVALFGSVTDAIDSVQDAERETLSDVVCDTEDDPVLEADSPTVLVPQESVISAEKETDKLHD